MTSDPPFETFEIALEHLTDRYSQGWFNGRRWGVTLRRSSDLKRVWLYAEDLAGTDIVSFNFYRLKGGLPVLKPCEMSCDRVIDFVLGYRAESG